MTPLGYEEGKQLAGLMTLKNFVEGGHEVVDGKILVCVKSIGGRKKCESSLYSKEKSQASPFILHLKDFDIALSLNCSHFEERQSTRKARRLRLRRHFRSDTYALGLHDFFGSFLETLTHHSVDAESEFH